MSDSSASNPKKPNLRDVAREAKVSVATVSRVLNGSSRVANKTADRVNLVIKALGFVPSPMARALNSGRTRTIGAVIPTLDHAIFAKFLESLEKRLAELNYALVVATAYDDAELEYAKTKSLLEMGVEGLVLSGISHHPDIDELAQRSGAPIVLTSYFDPRARHPTIGYDNHKLSVMGIEYLKRLGHRRIFIAHGPTKQNDRTRTRLAAIQANAQDCELQFGEVEISTEGGVLAAAQAMAGSSRPTAIFCMSDVIALGVMFELSRQGVRVPQDVSLMGFDNLQWSSFANPALTSIDLPVREMGLEAAESLAAHLNHGDKIAPKLLEGSIVERESTAIHRP